MVKCFVIERVIAYIHNITANANIYGRYPAVSQLLRVCGYALHVLSVEM